MAMSAQEIIKQHHAEMGRRGGQSKSAAKKRASIANLEKALSKRWKKKFRLRKPK
jgi:hypothetical protein